MKCKLYTVMARECGEDFRLSYNGFSKEEAMEKAVEHLKVYIEESSIKDVNFEECKEDLIKVNEIYVDDICEIVINETETKVPPIYGIKYDVHNDGWGLMDPTFFTVKEAQDFLKEHVKKNWGNRREEEIVDEIEENGTWYIDDECYFDIIQVV